MISKIQNIVMPGRDVLLELFRKASLIRMCAERFRSVIRSGRILAPYYSPRGHEVIAAAMALALRPDDYLVTIYRGLHDHLAKGVPLKELWAEYAGKATGSCKGKGGPMHITHPAAGVVVTTGIVGSGIPIANGLAWASLVKRDGRITVTSFGDGASNIGAFHEGLNLASVWQLPVVFLCQNNGYAEHTKYSVGTAVENVADRAAAYSMPGIKVDGTDAIAMLSVAKQAVDLARSGGGPTLIEAVTVRLDGHSMGDACEYIPKEEQEAAAKRDPLPRLRNLLLSQNIGDAELTRIEADIKSELDAAVDFSLAAPYPDVEELNHDVYDVEIPA